MLLVRSNQSSLYPPMSSNAVNHLHFIVGIKFGKMNAVNAKFKHRCKMSGGFTLLAYVLFDGAGGHSC